MEKFVHHFGGVPVHGWHLHQFIDGCLPDLCDIFEIAHQILSSGRADARYILKDRMYLRFASEASVIFDGKTVGLILQTGDHVKCLSIIRKFHFFIVKIQTSGSVVVILYHAADRNVQMQLVKNL